MGFNIALDGPSGAGKSTIAKLTAKKLGFVYVDTGALYRSIAYNALSKGVDLSDAHAVADSLDGLDLKLTYIDGTQAVVANGENVSDKIRTPEVSMGASKVSAVPEVRGFLLDTQRNIAKENDVIMDGRDIGTVVLPDAQVKIFLTASAEERADRRYKELKEKGDTSTYEEVLADIKQRDHNDTHREIAPLKQADDAKVIDSTDMTIDEVAEAICQTVQEKRSAQLKKKSDGEVKKNSRRESREIMPVRPITKTGRISLLRQGFYNFARPVVRWIFTKYFDLNFEGLENIPTDGGNIFASNHRSYGDPIFIALNTRVPISYMAKKELFHQNIFFTLLIKAWGAFPVERNSGDMQVIDTSINKLESGRNLVIFPEGTRSKDGKLGKGKNGVALIAAVAQTKVVPVGINFKGEKLAKGKHIVVRFGKPIIPAEIGATDASSRNIKILKKKIMEEISKLVY